MSTQQQAGTQAAEPQQQKQQQQQQQHNGHNWLRWQAATADHDEENRVWRRLMCKLRSTFCVLSVAVAGASWRLMEIHHYQRRSRLHGAFNEFSSDVQFNSLAALFPALAKKCKSLLHILVRQDSPPSLSVPLLCVRICHCQHWCRIWRCGIGDGDEALAMAMASCSCPCFHAGD